MSFRNNTIYALEICAVVVILAACGGQSQVSSAIPMPAAATSGAPRGKTVPPEAKEGRETQYTLIDLGTFGGPTQPALVGKETIDGSDGQSKVPYCSPSRGGAGYVSVSESGNATGPYPGTFTDRAAFFARCELSIKTAVSGAFTITSGAITILGQFSGPGTSFCSPHPWGETCNFKGKNLLFSARLISGGKVRKQFSGNVLATIGTVRSASFMNLTLKGL